MTRAADDEGRGVAHICYIEGRTRADVLLLRFEAALVLTVSFVGLLDSC